MIGRPGGSFQDHTLAADDGRDVEVERLITESPSRRSRCGRPAARTSNSSGVGLAVAILVDPHARKCCRSICLIELHLDHSMVPYGDRASSRSGRTRRRRHSRWKQRVDRRHVDDRLSAQRPARAPGRWRRASPQKAQSLALPSGPDFVNGLAAAVARSGRCAH